MKRIILLEKGDIVYNKEYNGFHQIREMKRKTAVISGCCNFLNDAKTTIANYEVSYKYLLTLKPVTKTTHKFIEWSSVVGAWRSTTKKTDTAYMFYRDKNVIKRWTS